MPPIKKQTMIIGGLILILLLMGGIIGYNVWGSKNSQNEFDEIAQIDLSGNVQEIHMMGDVLYAVELAVGVENQLKAYNISEPTQPLFLGSYSTNQLINKFAIEGSFAYLGTSEGGLEIVNISDLSNMHQVGHYGDSATIYGIQVSQGIAFLGAFDDGLEIVNVTDPTNPQKITTALEGERVVFVMYKDEICYVTSQYYKLSTINVSNPASPEVLDYIWMQGRVIWNPILTEEYVIAADHGSNDNVFFFNIENPALIWLEEEFISEARVMSFWYDTSTNFLFLATNTEGIMALDLSTLSEMAINAQYDDGGEGKDVCGAAGIIFFADWDEGIEIFQFC